jgi:hypothetical protein
VKLTSSKIWCGFVQGRNGHHGCSSYGLDFVSFMGIKYYSQEMHPHDSSVGVKWVYPSDAFQLSGLQRKFYFQEFRLWIRS